MNQAQAGCEFCNSPGGAVLWQNDLCRVVRVDEPDYPGYCRVILKRHAREMTDLDRAEREGFMAVVYAVEEAIRETMQPEKMNVASLGNMTPHLHMHVVPRFAGDRHFPKPIWAMPERESHPVPQREAAAGAISAALVARLGR